MPRNILSHLSGHGMIVAYLALFFVLAAGPAAANPLAYVALGDPEPTPSATGVAIVDMATGARVGTIPLTVKAFSIAINPAGTRAYVVDENGVDVIDLNARTVVKTISGVGGGDIAVDPSGTRAYVTNEGTNKLDVIDTASNTVTTSIPVGTQPRAVVVNAAGTTAYTGNTATPYSISVVDLASDTDKSNVSSVNLNRPENLGIAPSGAKVYAANFGTSAGGTTVGVLDTVNNSVGSFTVGTTPTSVVVNPSGTRAYVANRDSLSLSIIDTASSTSVGTVPLTFSPTHVAITPDGMRALITGQLDTGAFVDAILDLATNTIVAGPASLPSANGAAIAPAVEPQPAVKVQSGLSNEQTRFDATASLGGPIIRYDWSFGDGKPAPDGGATLAHTFTKAGTYTVTLTETDGCAPDAVIGPLGVSFNGHSAFCTGRRTSTKALRVLIPKAAVAVVRTKNATVTRARRVHLRIACVKELACTGTVMLRTAEKITVGHSGQKKRVKLGSASFKSIPAGKTRKVTVKLPRAALAVLRSLGTVKATATATARHAGGTKRSRTTSLTLTFAGP